MRFVDGIRENTSLTPSSGGHDVGVAGEDQCRYVPVPGEQQPHGCDTRPRVGASSWRQRYDGADTRLDVWCGKCGPAAEALPYQTDSGAVDGQFGVASEHVQREAAGRGRGWR
jgi:hypothetical protein